MIISLIAAVDEHNGLGKDNKLLCHLPADLQYFKALTIGKPIIMGRRTYESIGKPLPGRLNIILSRSPVTIEGVQVVRSLSQALNLVKKADEVMIIGGASVYKELLPFATKIYLTRIHHRFNADVFFPDIDNSVWRCVGKKFYPHDEKNNYDMTFCCYEKLE
ncbi:dihydrofolate reductase [Legionella fairfieldensis]|uniref:dihydrofolate reductase n=1 Tax=Legionella fairfieldensis TaxID=45064 RepID=UPI00055BA9E0|nr:dihydrofolate reductase [Legionella fairfieldensis]